MDIQEIANKLYEYCSQNKYEQAHRNLYSKDATSIEPPHSQNPGVIEGIDNIIQKGDIFQSMVEEYHGGYVNEPKVYGTYITMEMGMDVTMKEMGRMKMDELVVYLVKDGKIVSEQFIY